MRLSSIHHGVTIDEVITATGFELALASGILETRVPTDDELRLLDEVIDPDGERFQEVPEG